MNNNPDRSPQAWSVSSSSLQAHAVYSDFLVPPATVDGYRHHRMLSCALELALPGKSWLTIGDGRYGSEAIYLKNTIAASVYSSDLNAQLIYKAIVDQFLDNGGQQDAENLSFPDFSFDYVLAKECLHHLQNPFQALSESLRVSRLGVFVIEPNDQDFPLLTYLLQFTVALIKMKKLPSLHRFYHEEVGNFVYSLSLRDYKKFALSRGLTSIFVAKLNDYFHPRLVSSPFSCDKFTDKLVKLGFELKILFLNLLSFLRFLPHSYNVVFIPRNVSVDSTASCFSTTSSSRWARVRLPANPYA